MANGEAASIRTQAREVLNLHSDGQHEHALARAMALGAAHPSSALALNLVGFLHRHATLVARNDRGAPGGGGGDDDDDVSALEEYHRHAALDAFSAAARLAPDCIITNVGHAEALADCRRYEDAQKEFLRMLKTIEKNDQADRRCTTWCTT
ncbi:uncharacterized protein LOC125555940 isoform X2 [Triticum urartu]|uniref:uncharacterized protein LOC125555940 isoform X2 n=1 Tax=Triticum urartu TaxID=4572 RepID=UPI0020435872|nr:uncharacterized protein LOC125555940 isoform X2 [Triticum urartu]